MMAGRFWYRGDRFVADIGGVQRLRRGLQASLSLVP